MIEAEDSDCYFAHPDLKVGVVQYQLRLAKACKVEALRNLAVIIQQIREMEEFLDSQPGEVKK